MPKNKLQITDFRVKRALVLYKSGMSIPKFCKVLKMDLATITKLFKEHGCYIPLRESIRRGKSDGRIINDKALNVLTPDALYWIGFLYSDGSIEKKRSRISLTLSEIDRNHLLKFADFFGALLPRDVSQKTLVQGYKPNPAFRVAFSSKQIHERLKELGFHSRKTWNIIPHELLLNSRDFWRGVIDGDGWIINSSQQGIGLCGHRNTVQSFLDFVRRCGVDTKSEPLKSKRSEHLWSTELHSSKSIFVLNILYEGATTYLDRKYQKYQEIINQHKLKNASSRKKSS